MLSARPGKNSGNSRRRASSPRAPVLRFALLPLTLVQVMDDVHPTLRQLFTTYAIIKLAQRLIQPCEGGAMTQPLMGERWLNRPARVSGDTQAGSVPTCWRSPRTAAQ